MHLASKGLKSFQPVNTGGTIDLGAFSVTWVRADHSAGMGEAGVSVPLGNANGAIIKAKGEKTGSAGSKAAEASDKSYDEDFLLNFGDLSEPHDLLLDHLIEDGVNIDLPAPQPTASNSGASFGGSRLSADSVSPPLPPHRSASRANGRAPRCRR